MTRSGSRLTPASSACICVLLRLKFLAVLHSFQTSRSGDHPHKPVVNIRQGNPADWTEFRGLNPECRAFAHHDVLARTPRCSVQLFLGAALRAMVRKSRRLDDPAHGAIRSGDGRREGRLTGNELRPLGSRDTVLANNDDCQQE